MDIDSSVPQVNDTLADTAPNSDFIAGRGRRFGTLLIDYAGFFVFALVFGVIIGLYFGEAGLAAIESVPDLVFGLILMMTYYLFFECIWARTPGKFILGTVVVSEDGSKPGFGRIFKRTACRFIPFEAFSFFGDPVIGWHDSISGTRVIRKPKAI